MGLDFKTVGDEIKYWLANISNPYAPGRDAKGNPIGEWGIDIGLPYHTPVYAVQMGTFLGETSQYGGGGVVSVQEGPSASIYYQHLSDVVQFKPGEQIQAGELIGYSGGQIGYGDNPSSPQFSSGPHIEVGYNAPWPGVWHSLGKSINPTATLAGLAATIGGDVTMAPGQSSGGLTNPTNDVSSAVGSIGSDIVSGITSGISAPFQSVGITSFGDFMWRAGLILVAVVLLVVGVGGLIKEHMPQVMPVPV